MIKTTYHNHRDPKGRFKKTPFKFVEPPPPPPLTLNTIPLTKYLMSGNHKVPSTTAIFNMGPASTCPSEKLGFCQAMIDGKSICYALKAEGPHRPGVLPYRRRQESFWKRTTAENFAFQFMLLNSIKKTPYTALRFSEAGDFWSQECVDKAEKIASILAAHRIIMYCYTARRDLDFSKVKHLVISGSGFKKEGIANEFKMVEKVENRPKGYGICFGDCRICNRCLYRGKNTVVVKH